MQTADWQLCFPIVLRELGTRHASPQRFNPVESGAPPFIFHYSADCPTLPPLRPASPPSATMLLIRPMADGNPESPRLRDAFRALRYYNFRLFFAGQLISLIGTWMQTVAQSWLVYRLTGSSALLGLVGFSSQIPVFLFSPLGGVAADRHNRYRMIIATQTLSMLLALILAALTLTGYVRIWHLFVLSAMLGVVNAFDIPARQ